MGMGMGEEEEALDTQDLMVEAIIRMVAIIRDSHNLHNLHKLHT